MVSKGSSKKNNKKNTNILADAEAYCFNMEPNANPFIKSNQVDSELSFLTGDKISRNSNVRNIITDLDNLNYWEV